jgi:hypothetical protein
MMWSLLIWSSQGGLSREERREMREALLGLRDGYEDPA